MICIEDVGIQGHFRHVQTQHWPGWFFLSMLHIDTVFGVCLEESHRLPLRRSMRQKTRVRRGVRNMARPRITSDRPSWPVRFQSSCGMLDGLPSMSKYISTPWSQRVGWSLQPAEGVRLFGGSFFHGYRRRVNHLTSQGIASLVFVTPGKRPSWNLMA